MAAGPITQIADVVVPEIFTPYVQQITEEKARLVQSGVMERSAMLDALLAGGGLTFNVPSFRDLDNDDDRTPTDVTSQVFVAGHTLGEAEPRKIETSQEVAVRVNRNNSWASADLTANLAGADPLAAIANRVGFYWTRRLQAMFIATMVGIFNDNEVAAGAGEHVIDDMTNVIAGTAFVDGVTNFSAEAFLDAALTMGDSMEDLVAIMVHSVVFNRMQKNNLIDFIPDSQGMISIPTFLGREVIVDDGLPSGTNVVHPSFTAANGVFESWLFGRGSVALGVGSPEMPTEISRKAESSNGGGSNVLHSRVLWTMHPVGNAFVGTPVNGGPPNFGAGSIAAPSAESLGHVASWVRRFPERKQIKIARLITREAAP